MNNLSFYLVIAMRQVILLDIKVNF